MSSTPAKVGGNLKGAMDSAREMSQAVSLENFTVGVTIRRDKNMGRDGRRLILPSGLSPKHFEVIKAALETTYVNCDNDEWDECDLSRYSIKYFDMALQWQVDKKLVFNTKSNHRHFDEIAKRIRYLEFARDLGLDGMCVEIYRQLKEVVCFARLRQDDYRVHLTGFFVRKLLRQSDCDLLQDRGCSLKGVIREDRKKVEKKLEKAQQDLVVAREKEKKRREIIDLSFDVNSLEEDISQLEKILAKLRKEEEEASRSSFE